MQYRPTAAELLEAIGDLLGDEVIDAVPESLRHRVRVAHNLAQILEREQRLGDDAARREIELIHSLLDGDRRADADADLHELRAELSRRLRDSDDPAFERAAWDALVTVARDDVAIAKPGHDGWEGT